MLSSYHPPTLHLSTAKLSCPGSDSGELADMQCDIFCELKNHEWRKENGKYEDIKGFCNSASIERVKELDYVLTPGRYVGLPDDEDNFDFKERFTGLKAEFEAQLKEEAILNELIAKNLAKIELKNE